jgi:hypothetical protein
MNVYRNDVARVYAGSGGGNRSFGDFNISHQITDAVGCQRIW